MCQIDLMLALPSPELPQCGSNAACTTALVQYNQAAQAAKANAQAAAQARNDMFAALGPEANTAERRRVAEAQAQKEAGTWQSKFDQSAAQAHAFVRVLTGGLRSLQDAAFAGRIIDDLDQQTSALRADIDKKRRIALTDVETRQRAGESALFAMLASIGVFTATVSLVFLLRLGTAGPFLILLAVLTLAYLLFGTTARGQEIFRSYSLIRATFYTALAGSAGLFVAMTGWKSLYVLVFVFAMVVGTAVGIDMFVK
jgi:hypothetical protein